MVVGLIPVSDLPLILIVVLGRHQTERMSGISYIEELRKKVGNDLLLVPAVAALIHDSKGRLLLQEKSSGEGWSLPAGAIEPGETPQEAVVREVQEETGLAVEVVAICGVFGGDSFRYTYPNGDRVENVVTLFACREVGNLGGPRDAETLSTRYFTKADMPPLSLPYPRTLLFSPDPSTEQA